MGNLLLLLMSLSSLSSSLPHLFILPQEELGRNPIPSLSWGSRQVKTKNSFKIVYVCVCLWVCMYIYQTIRDIKMNLYG